MIPLFLYGTLHDPRVLRRESGDPGLARRWVPARLHDWRRVFLRGTPYPTLTPAAAAITEGMLVRVGGAALARLAAYEGPSYRLVPVHVVAGRHVRRARAWVAPRWRADRHRAWPLPQATMHPRHAIAARRRFAEGADDTELA